MPSALHGPKLKIERPKQHINDLNVALIAFCKTDFYDLRTEIDPKDGNTLLKFEIVKPLPEVTALIIGDAIHNLRSSIDLMVCDIVRANGNAPTNYTRFPFNKSRDQLVAGLNGGTIKKLVPADVLDLIVETVKPYNGGNDTLCALHELDILDKHMLLLPMMHVSALVGVDLQGNCFTFTNNTLAVEAGRVLIPISAPGEMHIKNKGKPALAVLFDKGLPVKGKPVIPTLVQFTELVAGIVETFEAHCFGKKP